MSQPLPPLFEFRTNPVLIGRMAEILTDPAFLEWLKRAQAASAPEPLPPAADAICSVRLHAESVGKNFILDQLKLAGTPLPIPEEEEPATYEEP